MKVSLRRAKTKSKIDCEAELRVVQLINMLIDGFYSNQLHGKEQEFIGLNIKHDEFRIECVEQYVNAIYKLKKVLTHVRKFGGNYGDYFLIIKDRLSEVKK